MNIIDERPAIPCGTTHHILIDGKPEFFRNDKKPNQKFVGGEWTDMYADANVAGWASPINKPIAVRHTTTFTASAIYPRKHVSGAYQGD
jgi:hypothetical protein